jgi:hypothetical protein
LALGLAPLAVAAFALCLSCGGSKTSPTGAGGGTQVGSGATLWNFFSQF